MALRPVLAAVAALLVLTGPARAADPVVAPAGDIACDPTLSSYNGGAGTADSCHMGAVAAAIQNAAPDVVLPLGDLQYEDGTLAKFNASYAPTWGRLKSISRPTPGNHEYFTDATGYFDYWGAGAGGRDEGWYSFDVPLPSGRTWHVVSLNSNCSRIGTCDTNSAEEAWLRGDLAAHPAACTLAFSHHPLFSSGGIGNITPEQQLWQTVYDAGVDLVLAGHDHDYERFAPQDPNGALDQAHGLREFIVGTGGKTLLAMGTTKPNSEVRQSDTYGFLKLQLHD